MWNNPLSLVFRPESLGDDFATFSKDWVITFGVTLLIFSSLMSRRGLDFRDFFKSIFQIQILYL